MRKSRKRVSELLRNTDNKQRHQLTINGNNCMEITTARVENGIDFLLAKFTTNAEDSLNLHQNKQNTYRYFVYNVTCIK